MILLRTNIQELQYWTVPEASVDISDPAFHFSFLCEPNMAELKDAVSAFRQHKLLSTKSYRKLHQYIVEQCIESLESHRTYMIGLFKDIVIDCHRDKRMTSLLNYFRDEEAEYLHYLQVLDSAVVNLSRSTPPVWEPFQGSIRPNPMIPEHIPVTESDVTNLPQRELSNCVDDGHISSPEVIPVSLSCPEHVPAFESGITSLPQKEQSNCMDDNHEHTSIPSPEVIPDQPVPPTCPEICFDPHRYTSQNYHDQQTIHLHQRAIQLCIDNLSAEQMSKHGHDDDEHDIHSNDYETLFKQLQPCSISDQSLDTVQIMCLKYYANDPPNIDTVNYSGMLICQNLPGG